MRLYPQSRLDHIVGQARTLLWTGTDPQIWLETEAADPAAALLAGADRARAHLANSDSELGYGLVNGTAVPTTFVGEYSLDDASDVVIATNGYPELAPHDQLSWPHAEAYLADLLAEDHNCVGALRGRRGACVDWHSFDDRSWIHLRRS